MPQICGRQVTCALSKLHKIRCYHVPRKTLTLSLSQLSHRGQLNKPLITIQGTRNVPAAKHEQGVRSCERKFSILSYCLLQWFTAHSQSKLSCDRFIYREMHVSTQPMYY
ncbi:hypothetical protein J6590_073915 [Homalodisca vitripennis]|nr:hypothetical protein J6590_073915 [Homalodisca vitripennis]